MATRTRTRRHFAKPPHAGRRAAVRRRPVVEAFEERALLTGYTAANVSELIAAIDSSNLAGGTNTITLTAASSSPYTLTAVDNTADGATGLPVIAAGNILTIAGSADTIERSTDAGTPAFRLLDVAAGATLNLQDLTLQNGLASGSTGRPTQGGAIYSAGTLSLDTVTVQNNTATSSLVGVGLSNIPLGGGVCAYSGSVTLTNCTVTGNSVADTGAAVALGGGVASIFATADLTGCTFSGNSSSGDGGGFAGFDSATVTLTGCVFTDNSAANTNSQASGGAGGGASIAGVTAAISDCTFTANSATDVGGGAIGGGLYCGSTATVSNCTFTANSSSYVGGGLSTTDGTLTDCTFTGNSAERGGGVVCDRTVTFTDCTLTGNSATNDGGGLSVGTGLGGSEEGGTVTLTSSTVSNNTAGNNGGGLYIAGGGYGTASPGIATLTNSIVSNNTAGNSGGGLYIESSNIASSTATLTSSTVSNNAASNYGGGLSVGPFGTATLSSSTLTGNSTTATPSNGGGMYTVGTAALTNCTIAGNEAYYGAGLSISKDLSTGFGGSTTLTNCTVSANDATGGGGGLFIDPLGLTLLGSQAMVTLDNTIVAEQTQGADMFVFTPPGEVIGADNVFSDAAYTPSSIVADPLLAPLGNYGGPTQTMALLPGSPAIDAGMTGAGIPTTDQRGTARDSLPDIGAFEVSAATSLAVAGFPSPTTAGLAEDFTVTALDAFGNIAADYTGTVSFTSSDGQAALPANYSFTSAIGGDLGVHTFTAVLKTAGTQSITATDAADSTLAGTESGITVNPAAASMLAVAGFPSPVTAGVAGSFTVTAFDPYGNVATGYGGTLSFSSSDNLATLPPTSTLTAGTGTFSATLVTTGIQSISASDGLLTGTQSGITVTPPESTTSLSSSVTSTVYGQPVTFTVTVSGAAPGGGTPTGTVAFLDGSTALGMATLSNGKAKFKTTALDAGSHTITASYDGDSQFAASTSGALIQTVNQAATTTRVKSSDRSAVFGESLTFTATVSAVSPGNGTPTGLVTFYNGSMSLGTTALVNGTGTFSIATLPVGKDSITAVYSGDTNFVTSTSSILHQKVKQSRTTSAITSSLNPSISAQTVTFTATITAVSPESGTPTGTVTFREGSKVLDTATLSDGTASFATSSLPIGSHSIKVAYGGDANFKSSTSRVLKQVVNATSNVVNAASNVVLASSIAPGLVDQVIGTFGNVLITDAVVADLAAEQAAIGGHQGQALEPRYETVARERIAPARWYDTSPG